MTTEKKTITITMSETAPVKVDPEQWPIIASAETHDGKVVYQANTEWVIEVREHADGRRLVYGSQSAGRGGQYAGYRGKDAGYLIAVDTQVEGHGSPDDMRRAYAARDKVREEQTIRAIRRVAGVIGDEDLGAECVGDLPAQEI
jgi:hypothetical protein